MTDPMRSRGGVGERLTGHELAVLRLAQTVVERDEARSNIGKALAAGAKAEAERDAALAEVARLESHTMGYLEERDALREDNANLLRAVAVEADRADAALARNRALEEGLRRQLEFVEAMETLKGAELRKAIAFPIGDDLRALLAPASPEREGGG